MTGRLLPGIYGSCEASVTLRHDSKLLQIGIGRRYAGLRIHLYVADLDVRVVTFDGELIRHRTLDPTREYQPQT